MSKIDWANIDYELSKIHSLILDADLEGDDTGMAMSPGGDVSFCDRLTDLIDLAQDYDLLDRATARAAVLQLYPKAKVRR